MNNKENNKKTLKWIFARIRRYFPLIILTSAVAAAGALTSVGIALVTKRVFDVATGEITGSLFWAGIMLFAIIAAQVILSALQSFISAYANGKLIVSIRNYLFTTV